MSEILKTWTVQGASPDQFFKARRHRSHTLAPSIVLFRALHSRHLLRQYDTLLMPKIVIRHIFAVYCTYILCRNSEGKIVFLFYYCHRCLKTLSVVACRNVKKGRTPSIGYISFFSYSIFCYPSTLVRIEKQEPKGANQILNF